MSTMVQNYYSILKVEVDSSMGDIKKSYRKLVKKYHPDRNSDPFANELFKKITKAFSILSDPKSRLEYDIILEKDVTSATTIKDLLPNLNFVNIRNRNNDLRKKIIKQINRISIDDYTMSLSVYELSNRILLSNNVSVKKVAALSLVEKNEKSSYMYLLNAIKEENDNELIVFYLELLKKRYGKKLLHELYFLLEKQSEIINFQLLDIAESFYCSKARAIVKDLLYSNDVDVRLKALDIIYNNDKDYLISNIYNLITDKENVISNYSKKILKEIKKNYRS